MQFVYCLTIYIVSGLCQRKIKIIPCAGKKLKGGLLEDILMKLVLGRVEIFPGRKEEKPRFGSVDFGKTQFEIKKIRTTTSITSITIR